ncbi:MAG TPA: hypothetical protein VFX63_16200 [Pyrinomonadaceae bacterium]|nr:hypothetical protein [Pyrinomonadaceae bacterium]
MERNLNDLFQQAVQLPVSVHIFYLIRQTEVVIVAVAHQKRRPGIGPNRVIP